MPAPSPPPAVRDAIVAQVRRLVGGTGDDSVERRRTDTGLFGPESVCWRVHGDLTSMMVGGIAALLLQMLHPGALAGVWDHSDFRRDMRGRLQRTARFIAGTTYGDRAEAQALIDRVRGIHDQVAGALPDGRAVDGILVVTVDGGLMAAGDPSTPARGLDDDGRAQLPPWLLRSSRRAGGARRRLHLRWRWVGARLAPGSSAARCSLCRKKKPLAWRCVGFL